MKKNIAVITISAAVADFYQRLLTELLGDVAKIEQYSFEKDTVSKLRPADLYLVAATSSDTYERAISYIPPDGVVVISDLTITKENYRKLAAFPKGTQAMLVNLSRNMAIESISMLHHLGLNNIEFTPVYPGLTGIPDIPLAITPGERRFVPPDVPTVLDIGDRVFTANVIMEIALKLGALDFLESARYREYISHLATVDYSLNSLSVKNLTLESKFDILLNALDTGIIGVDEDHFVFAINPAAENILGLQKEDVLDKNTQYVMPFIPFDQCKEKEMDIDFRLIKVKGTHINLSVKRIVLQGRYIGAFAVFQRFSDEENRQHRFRLQMLDRGHHAKYTFADIIGSSPAMKRACDIARKMARTDASILLTGESGTGKELFAHSIHNESTRFKGPFIAVNCAALTDTLLESELFGYEEGAFTGAKKSGKIGLFEYAHTGTIFLDEIESMSPNLQVKLLRVLQEKEITRVGSNKIIRVDVRVIAATNENIRGLVERGVFRKDLYYRLNALPIDIPPLRDRGQDIFEIMEAIQKEIGAHFSLTPAARDAFLHYEWDGNVRELRNYVEYLNYMELETVDIADLPIAIQQSLTPAETPEDSTLADLKAAAKGRFEEFTFLLKELRNAKDKGQFVGRQSLSAASQGTSTPLTEQEVRGLLHKLEEFGLVTMGRGRGGTRLTSHGCEIADII